MIRRAAILALLSCLIVGCSVFEAIAPAPGGTLTIEVRSGPAVDVRIGTRHVGRLECGGTAEFLPGHGDAPPLPWELQVSSTSDGKVLWQGSVSELPLWMLVTADGVATGDAPPIGPDGPPCSL